MTPFPLLRFLLSVDSPSPLSEYTFWMSPKVFIIIFCIYFPCSFCVYILSFSCTYCLYMILYEKLSTEKLIYFPQPYGLCVNITLLANNVDKPLVFGTWEFMYFPSIYSDTVSRLSHSLKWSPDSLGIGGIYKWLLKREKWGEAYFMIWGKGL